MADERFGGMLGMMQGNNRPYGGENPALQGLLGMMERQPLPFSTINGSAEVDTMLSSGDPTRRFKVYQRNMNSDSSGGSRDSSSSIAHWLFISEDGKDGFGFNTEGEQLELPKNLEEYELHPDFIGKTFTAAGLNNARQARRERFANMKSYISEHPDLFPEPDNIIDFEKYHIGGNNCQQYVQDLTRNYRE